MRRSLLPRAYLALTVNNARMVSIRFRFTPKSFRPTRDAERNSIVFFVSSSSNSTSSTKRKIRERNSARNVLGPRSTIVARGIDSTTATMFASAASADPRYGIGAIACVASEAWVETQFGVGGQGGSMCALSSLMLRWWSLAFGIACTMLLAFFIVSAAGIAVLDDPSSVMRPGPMAAVAGVLLLIADVFLPVPSSLVMVAHGALFGVVTGTLLSLVGSVASALTGFAVGRAGNKVIRRFVTEREHERAGAMLERWGVVAIAVSRPIPILAETVAILAGSSPMTWLQATLAATAGSIAPAAAYAWAGAHAHGLVAQTAILGGIIAVTAVLMLVTKRFTSVVKTHG
jgi:uncharacterized membrane protein YdjX (TVP38/TMEM64 family)